MSSVVYSAENELFDVIGSYGPWQNAVFLLFFYSSIIGIMLNYAMTFLAPNVPFRCVEPLNDSLQNEWPGQCTVQVSNGSTPHNWTVEVPCSKWEYDTSEYTDTLVSEWDLVCDREWLISFSKSVYMIGFLVSVFVFGQISDWIGRLPAVLISFCIMCIGLLLSLFSSSISSFLLFRFLQALGRTGCATTGFVLLMEIVGPQHRSAVNIATQVGWSVGLLAIVLVGYVFRHWFWFQVAITVLMLPTGFAYRLVPESPRWLMTHKKTKKLKQLLQTATTRNRRNMNEDISDVLSRLITVKKEHKGSLLDLFSFPNMRWRMIIMMYIWLGNKFVYYSLAYNTNDLSGNPYVNFLLLGVVEFLGYGFLFVFHRFGRRLILVLTSTVGGVFCIFIFLIPSGMEYMITYLVLTCKCFVTSASGLLILYTLELFPTVVRSAALGSCSTMARIGTIVSPFTRELGKASHPLVPIGIYCIVLISSGIFALWLPETAGRKMTDTLEEGENYDRQRLLEEDTETYKEGHFTERK